GAGDPDVLVEWNLRQRRGKAGRRLPGADARRLLEADQPLAGVQIGSALEPVIPDDARDVVVPQAECQRDAGGQPPLILHVSRQRRRVEIDVPLIGYEPLDAGRQAQQRGGQWVPRGRRVLRVARRLRAEVDLAELVRLQTANLQLLKAELDVVLAAQPCQVR